MRSSLPRSPRCPDAGAGLAATRRVAPRPALRFPDDFGAHPDTRTEWWYVTGALEAAPRTWGFQITFFRAATGVTGAEASRFAARQLVFAHAAVSDLEQRRRLRHDQRIARSGFGIAEAAVADTALVLRDWSCARRADDLSRYRARAASDSAGFAFDLELAATQPVLLQGQDGVSRKGPRREQTSRYYSEPQLERRRHARARRPAVPSPAAPGSTTNGATPFSTPTPSAGTGSA